MAAQAAALRRGVCAAAFRCWRHRELSPCLRAGRTSLCAELATKMRAWNRVTGWAELIPLAPLNLKTSFWAATHSTPLTDVRALQHALLGGHAACVYSTGHTRLLSLCCEQHRNRLWTYPRLVLVVNVVCGEVRLHCPCRPVPF
jgi:hypothetical protein